MDEDRTPNSIARTFCLIALGAVAGVLLAWAGHRFIGCPSPEDEVFQIGIQAPDRPPATP